MYEDQLCHWQAVQKCRGLGATAVLWAQPGLWGPQPMLLKFINFDLFQMALSDFSDVVFCFWFQLCAFFSCPGQLNKWHCLSVGLSVCRSEPTNNQSLLRDIWETFERLLRDFWETFERLLKDYWMTFERLLRDYWETLERLREWL